MGTDERTSGASYLARRDFPVMRTVDIPDDTTLLEATDVVRRWLPVTPVVASPRLGEGVFLKLETLLPTGSFKVRGGLASVAAATSARPGSAHRRRVSREPRPRRRLRGRALRCPRHRGAALDGFAGQGGSAPARSAVQLIRHGEDYEGAEAYALTLAAEVGGQFLSPYNNPHVIAGAGTIGGELLGQVPDLRTIVVPVGGGGLLSGIGLSTANSAIRLVGVEAERSRALSASLAAGQVVTVPVRETVADGLAGNLEPGSVTLELARRYVSEMVAVSEEEISGAIRFLASEHGLIVEGSGAVGVAALLFGRLRVAAGRCVVLVTGRNITHSEFGRILVDRALP